MLDETVASKLPSNREEELKAVEASIQPLQKMLFEMAKVRRKNPSEEAADLLKETPDTSESGGYSDSPISLPSVNLPGHFFGGGKKFNDDDVSKVGLTFRNGALGGLFIWAVGVFCVFRYAPADSYEEPHGMEKNAHLLSFILLLVTNGSRIQALILRDGNFNFLKSGVLVGTLTVQGIALVSNLMMSVMPTPVLVDDISGLRVHLLRWAEWVALSFLMCFLTDNIDAPLNKHRSRPKYFLSVCIALSTSGGAAFAFCPDLDTWLVVFTFSWVLFSTIYLKLFRDTRRYLAAMSARGSKLEEVSADTEESYELARSGFILTSTCAVTWTMLAVSFSLVCLAPTYAPAGSVLANPAVPVITTSVFEIASKICYLSTLIEAYHNVFDESTRSARRLEELRHFMSAVWESSSDVIAFCSRSEGRINARISPAFLKMVGLSTGSFPFLNRGDVSLVLEILPDQGIFYVFAMDLAKPVTRDEASKLQQSVKAEKHFLLSEENLSTEDKNLSVMANLAIRACEMKGEKGVECSSMEDLWRHNGDDGKASKVRCEARTAKLDSTSSVIVFRDISDRVQRFEAEKHLVKEMTIRKKDIEANRFTRHEVKNGILAAIGLVDHLREVVRRPSPQPESSEMLSVNSWQDQSMLSRVISEMSFCSQDAEASAEFFETSAEQSSFDMKSSCDELESTLTDILDTILDKAMAREIIYGEYDPRKEMLDVPTVLASLRRRTSRRFPLAVVPTPFPRLSIDRQLLRYIYRNAISNACKYGKAEGLVETRVHYKNGGTFEMEVTNLPGTGHAELQTLDEETVDSIFSPGTQLSATRSSLSVQAEMIRNDSSGNGAWIMQKCAEALGGKCSMRFEKERTVFTFSCPVEEKDAGSMEDYAEEEEEEFCLPKSIQAIVIDDSMIQRKLLSRFLAVAGVDKSRCHILGKDASEVFGFADFVLDLMKKHPDDKFLIIADENLDIVDGGARHETVSGSRCVEQLRAKLDASEERRLLALIRSANDSARDLEVYRSRAHGYLLKEPLKNERVLDTVRPWWTERFPSKRKSYVSFLPRRSGSESGDNYGPSAKDIDNSLKKIDALCCTEDDSALKMRWLAIREKLHTLRGDIKTMPSKDSLVAIDKQIDSLVRYSSLPLNFHGQWLQIRTQIESILGILRDDS